MTIYHLNARGVAPARGSSAVASAAYQSGEALRDELTGDENGTLISIGIRIRFSAS